MVIKSPRAYLKQSNMYGHFRLQTLHTVQKHIINWIQLQKRALEFASGYLVNLSTHSKKLV